VRYFAATVVRYRHLILAVVCIATVWFAFHAAALRTDPDPLGYLPGTDLDVRFFREAAQRYKLNQITLVALPADDIFTASSLSDLRKITGAVQTIRGVRHVQSITNLLDVRIAPEGFTRVCPLIDPRAIPRDPETLAALRATVLGHPMLAGSLVSEDGRAAMVSIILDPDADRAAVAREIRGAAQDAAPGRPLVFGGLAMVLDAARTLATRDACRWMPLAVLAILALAFLGTGSLRGVLLPLGTVVLATVWTLGTLALAGIQLSVLTSVAPAVILVLGTAPGIYLIVRYHEEQDPEPKARAEQVLAREGWVLLRTGFVVLAGLFSLGLSDLALFREFGQAAGFGFFWSLVLSLTFLPACLAYLPCRPARAASLASPEGRLPAAALARLAELVMRRKTAILVLSACPALAALALVPWVPRHMNMMSYFPEGSEPREAERLLAESFGGSQLIHVNFRAADVRSPAILEQMDLLEKRLRLVPDVNYPLSVADVLKELNRNLNQEPGLPDSLDKIQHMWFMLEGQPSIDLLLDKGFRDGAVSVRIGDSDPDAVARAVERVRRIVQETVPEDLFLIDLAGQPEAQRRAFLEEMAARIARKAALDARYHAGLALPEGDLAAALCPILTRAPALSPEDRELLRGRIEEYLAGDESDLRISDGARTSPLAARLARQDAVSPASLEAALQETLPRSGWAAAPEDLAYTADHIRGLYQQGLREKRFREARAAALQLAGLSPGGADHPALRRDLDADLWGVNNTQFAVTSQTWFRITGRERPWENRVEFEVRLTGLPAVSLQYDGILGRALLRSTFNALVIVLVLLILLLGSPSRGFAAASPLFLTSLGLVAALALPGMAVDSMTVVYLSLAMSVSVLYALPLIARGAQGLARGLTPGQVLEGALTTRGRAVLIHTTALAPGFLLLGLSSMGPLRQFGLFVALALALASLAAFFTLPALMLRGNPGKKTIPPPPGPPEPPGNP